MKPYPLASGASTEELCHTAAGHEMALRLDLARMQRDQYCHDMRNHFDILALHKHDRLKHYGLHFAKYIGRVARGSSDPKPVARTVVDTLLVCLSAANTLHQDLSTLHFSYVRKLHELGHLCFLADAAGRFADACEKIDHLEEFVPMARAANADVLQWVIYTAISEGIDLVSQIRVRREQLARRQFFIEA